MINQSYLKYLIHLFSNLLILLSPIIIVLIIVLILDYYKPLLELYFL